MRGTWLALGACLISGWGHALVAGQPLPAAPGDAGLAASTRFDGRTFGGVDLPAPLQSYPLNLAASRVWSWREANTERLLLDRDVRITLGPYTFESRRAVVWLEPVRIQGVDAEQVALYFDRVTNPSGPPTSAQEGERLLVTAIITRTEHTLRADVLASSRPDDAFVTEAEARLSRYLDELTAPPRTEAPARLGAPGSPATSDPADVLPDWIPADDRPPMPPASPVPIDEPRDGLVNFYAENIEWIDSASPEESTLLLTGGVVVQHQQLGDGLRPGTTVQISAQRAVAFIQRQSNQLATRFDQQEVLGVYLEGDVVATTGQYTLRGSQVFYDVRADRAIVIDAVFWTYDEERGMPIYMRADAIRQESRNQWSAKDVRLANVGFAEPHFSIGAREVTLTRAPRAAEELAAGPGKDRAFVDAKGVTFRFGETPVAYLPSVSGELRPSILRGLSLDSEDGDPILRTEWDLYNILGLDAAPGNRASLLLDGYFARGVGVGADLDWRTSDIRGNLLAYYIHDDGTDQLPTGSDIEHDDDDRGIIDADQIWRLDENWTLFAELAYISDETFVPAFYRADAEERREYISSLYARRLDDNTGLELEVRGTLNDFISNQYLLQTPGYTVEKLPEASYHRIADELFGGLLSWSSEYSLSAMSLEFNEPTSAEMGFRSARDARDAFGLLPDQSIGDALRAQGYTEENVLRADTRQEFEMPLRAGALNIVPFAVGRATAWDDNFEQFSGEDNDPYRLWGSGGVRFFTTIQRVDDSAKLDALDIDRIRHIVEPSATVWHAGATLDQSELPIYDYDVESLATGTAARIGIRNTWQTMRGRPGEKQSADLLILDTHYVWSSGDVDPESPYGAFIEARPELSTLGEYITNDLVFNVTDAVALTAETNYNVADQSLARQTGGVVIDHGFGFSTLVEYRLLDIPKSSLIEAGARYELTRKYALILSGTYDVDRTEFQGVRGRIERRFPQWTVDVYFDVDNVSDDFSIGMAVRPAGLAGEERTRVFSRDVTETPVIRRVVPGRERVTYGPLAD